MDRPPRCFAIKARIDDPLATAFAFHAQKTMYGGKGIAPGDRIFLFASEHDGGRGLIARGRVTACERIPRTAARETPRVSIAVTRDGTARHPFGRTALCKFRGMPQDSPQAELDFKLYRQATNKIVGLCDATGTFLDTSF